MKRVLALAVLLLSTIAFAVVAMPIVSGGGAIAGLPADADAGVVAGGADADADAGVGGVGAGAGRRVPASEAPREIAALLALLRTSPCRFERNGRWYDGEKAAAHLQRKLDYAVGRGHAIGSTELFIDMAATRSSFSGRAYRVRCGDAAAMPAAHWFRARLEELRTP